jgi:hypothetical protein
MAANTNPIFLLTPNVGATSVSTANTSRSGSGTIATVFTAGANGSKINQITIKATDDPADSTVVFFLHDGSNFFVFDEWDIGNPAAGSTTVASYTESRVYANLVLPNLWSLRASITVAPTGGVVNVIAMGGNY